ncbi:hypothetical protein A6302_00543 [Methylobrevis pamukkalensis]|uniref:Uncharacterized protein n=1 Tax=Methylobrevis pamukkalensis TaxID=1439726 RepID=A0A1E3H726_9HYPH|nr:hypothetical protein A6302_00543 [Methylobrevis pamukkalensis]
MSDRGPAFGMRGPPPREAPPRGASSARRVSPWDSAPDGLAPNGLPPEGLASEDLPPEDFPTGDLPPVDLPADGLPADGLPPVFRPEGDVSDGGGRRAKGVSGRDAGGQDGGQRAPSAAADRPHPIACGRREEKRAAGPGAECCAQRRLFARSGHRRGHGPATVSPPIRSAALSTAGAGGSIAEECGFLLSIRRSISVRSPSSPPPDGRCCAPNRWRAATASDCSR